VGAQTIRTLQVKEYCPRLFSLAIAFDAPLSVPHGLGEGERIVIARCPGVSDHLVVTLLKAGRVLHQLRQELPLSDHFRSARFYSLPPVLGSRHFSFRQLTTLSGGFKMKYDFFFLSVYCSWSSPMH